jgi:competence protein ComEC
MPFGTIMILLAYFNITPDILIKVVSNSIKGMNYFINFIASFDNFVLKEIPFTQLMLILTYTLLGFFISWINAPNFKKMAGFIIVTISLQTSIIYYKAEASKNGKFLVFNSKNNTIIGEVKNKEMLVYSRYHIKKATFEENIVNTFSTANFYRIKKIKSIQNCYYYNDHKILLIDSTLQIPRNKTADILILTQSAKLNLERILHIIQPKQVIADASNFKNYIEQWKLTCKKNKIPFHSTYEKGFYAID